MIFVVTTTCTLGVQYDSHSELLEVILRDLFLAARDTHVGIQFTQLRETNLGVSQGKEMDFSARLAEIAIRNIEIRCHILYTSRLVIVNGDTLHASENDVLR